LYNFQKDIANSNFALAVVTLVVGGIAIYLYISQKRENKRDAARIIVQEIRRAEDIISDYKKTGSYQFARKIIPTNSWAKNIHLFVGDLHNDELDKISDLYSVGEYLDRLVSNISDVTFKHDIKAAEKIENVRQQALMQNQPMPTSVFVPPLLPVWKIRLESVSSKIDPIYHSTIVEKLRKIAGIK
jgi:hypothetical protein